MTPGRRAIVAFSDTDEVSEDWNWFYADVTEACAGTDISVTYAGPGVDDVTVAPGERVTIGDFRVHRHGYVFTESGREPRFQPYDQSRVLLAAASEYFGTDLRR